MKRFMIRSLFAIIVIGVGMAIFFALWKSSTSINELAFNEISIVDTEDKLVLNGILLSSGKSYRGYTYRIQNDNLYITINSGIVCRNYQDGHFEITIEDPNISSIQQVYLQDGNDSSLIFPRSNK